MKRPRFNGKVQAFLTNHPEAFKNKITKGHSVLYVDDQFDDLNLPMPVCQGIRRVCAFHDKSRKYKKYQKDGSDDYDYQIQFSPEHIVPNQEESEKLLRRLSRKTKKRKTKKTKTKR